METDFFIDNKTSISGIKAMQFLDQRGAGVYSRLEECVLNAKTPLAKRRLVRTILFIQQMDFPQL